MTDFFHRITTGPTRLVDAWGSGQHGASRGGRRHHGLDVVSIPGEPVFSPIDGVVVREALPYRDTQVYRGLLIKGFGRWQGYEIKMFYVEGVVTGNVRAGQTIGRAQDIRTRYPGITNHVHLEVRKLGVEQSPLDCFGMSF